MELLQSLPEEGIIIYRASDGQSVIIKQTEIVKNRIFTSIELHKIGKRLYPDTQIIATSYSLDLSDVTPKWIQARMEQHGVTKRDIGRHIGISGHTLDQILSGEKELYHAIKATFYFYFLSLLQRQVIDRITEKYT